MNYRGYSQSPKRSRSRTRKLGQLPNDPRREHTQRRQSRSTDQRHSVSSTVRPGGPRMPPMGNTRPRPPPQPLVQRTKLPRYSKGYHALLAMVKELKDLREDKERFLALPPEQRVPALPVKDKRETGAPKQNRRSRSYSRGRSVYFTESGQNGPHFRSRSVGYSTDESEFTKDDVIHLTYTGRISRATSAESRASRSRSRRGSGIVQKKIESVPPHRRDSYTFDDFLTKVYQQIKTTYGEPGDIKQKQFFTSLALIQLEHKKLKKLNMSKSDRQFLERTFEEVKNLKLNASKVLHESEKLYSSRSQDSSPIGKKMHSISQRPPLADEFLQRQRTRGRIKLKPIIRNREDDVNRTLAHDFYTRRRNSENTKDVRKQQSRQYTNFEPYRPVPKQGLKGASDALRPAKPLTRLQGNPGKTAMTPRAPEAQNTYRDAKLSLMYRKNRATHLTRTSPGDTTKFRHRMHGLAK